MIELLAVLAIIVVLVAMLVPAIQKTREASNRMQCGNNLRQIALGIHQFHDTMKRIPYNQCGPPYGFGGDSNSWSWLARILPYVEQTSLYNLGQIPVSTLRESRVASEQIALFLCPSDASGVGPRFDAGNLLGIAVGQTNYKGVSGANWGDDLEGIGAHFNTDWRNPGTNGSFDGHSQGDGMFYRRDYLRPLRLDSITDGASNTFMVGEAVPAFDLFCSWPYANNANGTCAIPPNVLGPKGKPYPPRNWQNAESFRSRHPGGLQFAHADGSVHFVSDGISLQVYRALATISGGEAASLPD